MLIPNTILQTAGWGLVNGPLGKARMDIIRKQKTQHNKPAEMFFSTSVVSLKIGKSANCNMTN